MAGYRLGEKSIEAEVFEGGKLVAQVTVLPSLLRSLKSTIETTGKGAMRWFRALEEVATGTNGPIKVEKASGGTPVPDVTVQNPKD